MTSADLCRTSCSDGSIRRAGPRRPTGASVPTACADLVSCGTFTASPCLAVLTNHRSKLLYPSALTDTTTTDYLAVLTGTEHVRADLTRRSLLAHTSAADRAGVATAVPYAPAAVPRRIGVGDVLLVHGQLTPAWIRTSR